MPIKAIQGPPIESSMPEDNLATSRIGARGFRLDDPPRQLVERIGVELATLAPRANPEQRDDDSRARPVIVLVEIGPAGHGLPSWDASGRSPGCRRRCSRRAIWACDQVAADRRYSAFRSRDRCERDETTRLEVECPPGFRSTPAATRAGNGRPSRHEDREESRGRVCRESSAVMCASMSAELSHSGKSGVER